jgi:hypothetical protein
MAGYASGQKAGDCFRGQDIGSDDKVHPLAASQAFSLSGTDSRSIASFRNGRQLDAFAVLGFPGESLHPALASGLLYMLGTRSGRTREKR